MEEKRIVDTTLRDGEQSAGIALSQEDKESLAVMLDHIGVYEIEAGSAGMKAESIEYIQEVKSKCSHSKISMWSRMKPSDIRQAVKCKPDIIHIGAPVSYVQIYSKLKKNKTWVQTVLSQCVDIALSAGIEVTVGFEDASRSDEGFMINTAKLIERLGVSVVRVADTVGVLTPIRTEMLIRKLKGEVDMDIEFHAHNDFGMAIANSIAGAKAGAKYIDCTLMGIGERSGNCDLYKYISSSDRAFEYGIDKKRIADVEGQLIKICNGIEKEE